MSAWAKVPASARAEQPTGPVQPNGWQRVRQVVSVFGSVLLYTAAMSWVSRHSPFWVGVLTELGPFAALAALYPLAVRRWWRLLAVIGIIAVANPVYSLFVFLAATTWYADRTINIDGGIRHFRKSR